MLTMRAALECSPALGTVDKYAGLLANLANCTQHHANEPRLRTKLTKITGPVTCQQFNFQSNSHL
jgi:hypothetical protein